MSTSGKAECTAPMSDSSDEETLIPVTVECFRTLHECALGAQGIYSLSKRLLHTQNLEVALGMICISTVRELQVPWCMIYLVSVDGDCLDPFVSHGHITDGQTKSLPIGSGYLGRVACSRRAKVINDRFEYQFDEARLAVPILLADGKAAGVIDVRHHQGGTFTHDHIDRVVAMASMASNKIEIDRLREEVRLLRKGCVFH